MSTDIFLKHEFKNNGYVININNNKLDIYKINNFKKYFNKYLDKLLDNIGETLDYNFFYYKDAEVNEADIVIDISNLNRRDTLFYIKDFLNTILEYTDNLKDSSSKDNSYKFYIAHDSEYTYIIFSFHIILKVNVKHQISKKDF